MKTEALVAMMVIALIGGFLFLLDFAGNHQPPANQSALIEFQQQAVDYGYAEWSDLGYGKTEFRFIEPTKPDVAPEPKPVKPIGAVGSAG